MPRRTITGRQHGRLDDGTQRLSPDVVVRWGPRGHGDVQIGLATPDEGGAGTGQHHVVSYWYGDAATLQIIGAKAVEWARSYCAVPQPELNTDEAKAIHTAAVGRSVLDMVTGSSVNGGVSWWTDLDREGCQEVVRWLRKARDDEFGRDE